LALRLEACGGGTGRPSSHFSTHKTSRLARKRAFADEAEDRVAQKTQDEAGFQTAKLAALVRMSTAFEPMSTNQPLGPQSGFMRTQCAQVSRTRCQLRGGREFVRDQLVWSNGWREFVERTLACHSPAKPGATIGPVAACRLSRGAACWPWPRAAARASPPIGVGEGVSESLCSGRPDQARKVFVNLCSTMPIDAFVRGQVEAMV